MKKNGPLILVIVVGFFMVLEYFIPHHFVQVPADTILEWGKVIAGATIMLGIYSLVHVNVPTVLKRKKDWQYKLVLLLGFFTMLILSLWGKDVGTPFDYVFMNLMRPMGATMFALLAFYIASAAFRSFRARSFEATLMLIAAIVVMLGRVPLGELIFNPIVGAISSAFGTDATIVDVMEWIMNVPNLAGKRAVLIGAALGVISTSLRIILGLERSYMGGD